MLARSGVPPRLKRQATLHPDVELGTEDRAELDVAIDEALDRLKAVEPREAQVVECRFFGG